MTITQTGKFVVAITAMLVIDKKNIFPFEMEILWVVDNWVSWQFVIHDLGHTKEF